MDSGSIYCPREGTQRGVPVRSVPCTLPPAEHISFNEVPQHCGVFLQGEEDGNVTTASLEAT